ncbi:cytochrome P450 98A3 [Coprinopsis sp. MPI-PUGE-AT-0042]|nr:cytochrome P450 98A3 [Coprinopsis sp. MPI-PUGE-AT-0042]
MSASQLHLPKATLNVLALQWQQLLLLALGLTVFIVGRRLRDNRRRNPRGLPLPPGPKGLPIIGSALEVPSQRPWLTYTKWRKEYGDVVYAEALGKPMLILNSFSVIHELLEKRASNFSHRPVFPVVELMGFDWTFSIMNYGSWWRQNRKAFHQFLNHHEVTSSYRPIIHRHTMLFLRRLLENPENFFTDTHFCFSSIIMQISYGVGDMEYNTRLMHVAEAVARGFVEAAIPGRYMVNTLPFLRYVPAWFPGAGWRRRLRALTAINNRLLSEPYEDAKVRASQGIQSDYPNIIDSLVERLPAPDDPEFATQETIARCTAATSYAAGADTTGSSANGLFLALAMFPEAQKKAQEEIDRVVGGNRLPEWKDIENLHYVRALLKELSRWHTVAPFAVPHAVAEDDEFNGYFLPKGTVVFPNTWGIFHDPELFPEPHLFKPERFLKDGKLDVSRFDPHLAAFGYGRRICPGRHLSNEGLSYMAALTLATFNVNPPKDAQGNRIALEYHAGTDLIVQMMPFKCEIVPRSDKHVQLFMDQ